MTSILGSNNKYNFSLVLEMEPRALSYVGIISQSLESPMLACLLLIQNEMKGAERDSKC